MTLTILAFLAGILTILSPCILPVLPFVFSRAEQPFRRSGLPLLAGGGEFSTVTPAVGRDSALLGAGTVFHWAQTVSFFFNYLGDVGRTDFYSNNFDGGVRLRF